VSTHLRVAVLYGGPSGEHEISLRSAASVIAHLSPEKYQIIPIGINKQGECFYTPVEHLKHHTDELPVNTEHSERLPSLITHGQFVIDVDVVFPIVHGPLLEDGALQGLLELAQVAFVGSGVMSSAIGMDKDMTRQVVRSQGIQFTRYQSLSIHATPEELDEIYQSIQASYQFPLFVKPCCMGSSVGIHKVNHIEELSAAVQDAFHYDEYVLVEEGVQGREIELAVLENEQPNHPPLVSVPGELKVHHADGFYSYIAKYIESNQTELNIPASLPPAITKELQTQAAKIFTALKCKGMARVDFFVDVDSQKIIFNEINTLPGFTSISMYPQLWQASGLEYTALLDQLIQRACVHFKTKQQLVRDFR
jgi:D-alanine-D-alanine ligase